MALEQSSSRRLRRTAAARTLDPTEKGAVNYFLGLTICKLFAAKLLDAPWMLHLDVFRPYLDVMLASRSRPDLVGQTLAGNWIVLECKGRISSPDTAVKNRAKQQAMRVVSISGAAPSRCIGGIAFFKNDVLQFYWRDPDPETRNPIRIEPSPQTWSYYYRPALELVQSNPTYLTQMRERPTLMPVPQADIKVGIRPEVLRHLEAAQWEDARTSAQTLPIVDTEYHRDGIAIVAGPSWLERFAD